MDVVILFCQYLQMWLFMSFTHLSLVCTQRIKSNTRQTNKNYRSCGIFPWLASGPHTTSPLVKGTIKGIRGCKWGLRLGEGTPPGSWPNHNGAKGHNKVIYGFLDLSPVKDPIEGGGGYNPLLVMRDFVDYMSYHIITNVNPF